MPKRRNANLCPHRRPPKGLVTMKEPPIQNDHCQAVGHRFFIAIASLRTFTKLLEVSQTRVAPGY